MDRPIGFDVTNSDQEIIDPESLPDITGEEQEFIMRLIAGGELIKSYRKSFKQFDTTDNNIWRKATLLRSKNRIVNRVAEVIREEFGFLTEETENYLESIRIGGEPEREVSIRTMEKRLQKMREEKRIKDKKEKEKNVN